MNAAGKTHLAPGYLVGYRFMLRDMHGTVVYEKRFDHHLRKYPSDRAVRKVLTIIGPELTRLGVRA